LKGAASYCEKLAVACQQIFVMWWRSAHGKASG
jgi:hypothetical protein